MIGSMRAPHRIRYEGFPVQRLAIVVCSMFGALGAFLPWAYTVFPALSMPGTAGDGLLTLVAFLIVLVIAAAGRWSKPMNAYDMLGCFLLGVAAALVAARSMVSLHDTQDTTFRSVEHVRAGSGAILTLVCGLLCAVFACLPWIGPQEVED